MSARAQAGRRMTERHTLLELLAPTWPRALLHLVAGVGLLFAALFSGSLLFFGWWLVLAWAGVL